MSLTKIREDSHRLLRQTFPELHFNVEQSDNAVMFRASRGMSSILIVITNTGHVMTTATTVSHEENSVPSFAEAISLIRVTL